MVGPMAPYHRLCGHRHWNACPLLWGGGDPIFEKRPVRVPLMGSINEPKLWADGWRIVRDPATGEALHEERFA